MNNKGFTLVELLAVIIILLGISLIVISSVTSSLERREGGEVENQQKLAINAAKIYFSLNDTGETSVTIEKLVTNDYLSKDEISKLKDCDSISVGDTKYIYMECSTE